MNIAIITGASSGLGKEFLKQTDSYNFDEIWVIARQKEKLEALRDIVHTNLKIIPLDLSLNSSFKIYEEELKKEKPNVKLLINCAGFGKFGNYSEIPLEDSLKMIDLNCKALVSMTEKTLPFMNEFSKILQICSSSSFQPLPFANVYASTKAFVLSYSRALNYELKERRILVTAVCPGWVRTNFFETAKKTKNPKYYWCGSKDEPNGCSPGSPVDVLIPKNIAFNTCFITEGKFKIEKIIEEFTSPAISVQGVGNWRGKINPEIKFISKNYFNIRNIFCCYDADLSMNFSIFTACRDLIKEELKDLDLASVKIAVWDYKLGKGLDDMINNGHKDKLISIDFNYFAEYFEEYIEEIKKMYPNTTETKILDSNNNEVDENIIHQIYKDKVLNPLNIYCL